MLVSALLIYAPALMALSSYGNDGLWSMTLAPLFSCRSVSLGWVYGRGGLALPPRLGRAQHIVQEERFWRGEELERLSCALRSRSRLIVLSPGALVAPAPPAPWPLQNRRRRRRAAEVPHRRDPPRITTRSMALHREAYGPSNKAFTQGHGVVPIPSMPQCRRSASILGGRPETAQTELPAPRSRPVQGCVGERPPRRLDSLPPLSRSGRTRPLPAPRPTCSCQYPAA